MIHYLEPSNEHERVLWAFFPDALKPGSQFWDKHKRKQKHKSVHTSDMRMRSARYVA